jgi:hypothetical protein
MPPLAPLTLTNKALKRQSASHLVQQTSDFFSLPLDVRRVSLRSFQQTSGARYLLLVTAPIIVPSRRKWIFFKSVGKST